MKTHYNKLTNQPSDIESRYLDKIIEGYPTILDNKFPIDVYVFLENRNTGNILINTSIFGPSITTYIGSIKSYGTMSIPFDWTKDGDLLHFKYLPKKYWNQPCHPTNVPPRNLEFLCPSIEIVKRYGKILIGNTITYPKTYRRDIHPGGDVSSINLHNMLPFPITIISPQISTKPIIYLDKNNHLGTIYHGDLTQSPIVYFDNFNRGLKLGTKFDVYADGIRNIRTDGRKDDYVTTFILSDIDQDHIFIGEVSHQIDESFITGANARNERTNGVGTSIYRIGRSKEIGDSEGIRYELTKATSSGVMPKNYSGEDKHRNPQGKSRGYGTVKTAKYAMLSGNNVVEIGINSK